MWNQNEQEEKTSAACSFCGKSQDQVNHLTVGPRKVCICNECVDLYREHIEKMVGKPPTLENISHVCTSCGTHSPASHRYCYTCGSQFTQET